MFRPRALLAGALVLQGLFFASAASAGTITYLGANGRYAVPDGAQPGYSIGEVRALTTEPGASIRYTLVSGEGFAVDSSTGALSVAVSPSLAAGVVRHIVVRASDGVGTASAGFDVLVSPTSSFALGGVLREKWEGVPGSHVSDLIGNAAYAGAPTSTINQSQIDMAPDRDRGSDFGMRFSAYLIPPSTGTYNFWIAADDAAELWLGTGASQESMGTAPIASLDSWTSFRNWTANPSQKSADITLVKGQIYAIKALHKEASGAEHISVAWRGPGMKSPTNGSGNTVIPSSALLAPTAFDWTPPSAPRNFAVSAVDASGVHLAWHSVIDTSGIVKYVLYRDGVHLADAGPGSGGVIKYTDAVTVGAHSYAVEAVDGFGHVSARSEITNVNAAVAYEPLPIALSTGDSRVLPEADTVLTAALTQAETEVAAHTAFLNNFFGGIARIRYKPKLYGGQILKPATDAKRRVFPILTATDCAGVSCGNTTRSLAVAGTTAGGTRFAAFGDEVFINTYGDWPIKTVKWLMTGSGTGSPSASSSIAILNSSSAATAAKSALVAAGIGNASTIATCTSANIPTCLAGRSLLIIGAGVPGDANANEFKSAVQTAVAGGVPILYEEDAGFYENASEKAVKSFLGFEYDGFNYFSDIETKWSAGSSMVADLTSQTEVYGVKTLLNHFKNNDWDIGFSSCGDYDCSSSANKQEYLRANFYLAARDYLQSRLNEFDADGTAIFDQSSSSNRLVKLLVLLGDLYRRDTRFPLTPTKVPAQDFFKSLFADYAHFQSRLFNPQQPDLGTFSGQISSRLERFDVNVTAKTLKVEHSEAAGVYALPGETVTFLRKDDSAVSVKAFINTIQPSSTKEFSAYSRPKFLKSIPVTLKQNVPVRITSAYGGPVQLLVQAGLPSKPVAVQIRHVGRHPVWRTELDSEEFDDAVAKGEYDWSEVITPAFQAHIRSGRMDQSLADESWNTPSKLASATYRYIFQSSYELAGQLGPGLSLSAPVRAICQTNGWNCSDLQTHGISPVVSANVDLSSCGEWCAGNPYDSSWGLTPASWRDSYAVGLNLKRFLVNGFSTEPSIDIFPTRAAYMWNREHPDQYRGTQSNNGGNLAPWRQDYTYAVMRAARSKPDPITYVKNVIWGTDSGTPDVPTPYGMAWWAQRLAFYIQLVQQSRVRTDVKFGNGGWDFWTLMYLLDREVEDSTSSGEAWLAKRDTLGFSDYTLADIQAIDRNDRLLVEASRVSKMDQRPFFDLWGLTYSAKASGQVASLGYKAAEKRFWYFGTSISGVPDYFNDALGSIPVDGSVANVPNVPLNFMWTPSADNTVNVSKAVTLSAALGTPGTVAFKLDGQVIPGCGAVPTTDRHWPNNYVADKYASCSWIPRKIGEAVLTTTLTPSDSSRLSSTSVPLPVSIADSPGAPHVDGVSGQSAVEGANVTLNGSEFIGVTDVSFNGVKSLYTVNSPTSITVTVPKISPVLSVGRFSVSTSSGYTAYLQEDFTVWRPVAQVAVDKTSVSLNRGQVTKLSSTVTPDYATDPTVAWSSSDPAVASVDPDGTVTATGLGSANVSATSTDGAKVATSTVKVVEPAVVQALRVVPADSSLDVDQGATIKPDATVQPANATEKGTTWRSLDTSIATVDSAGNVTGVEVGNTTLVVTAASGAEASVPLRVNVPVTVNDVTNATIGMTSSIEFSSNNGTTWKRFDGTNLPPLTGNRVLLARKFGTTAPVKQLVFTDGVNSASNPLVSVNPANTFLSDLTPSGLLNGWGPLELDSSNGETGKGDGVGLAINGVTYARGLGAHATFNAVYSLGGKFTTFLADVGPDDEAAGSVDFGVVVDGVTRYQSGVIRKVDGAKRVNVNVAGANSLKLTIADGGSNGGDHADWAGAQLVPAVTGVSVTPGAVRLKPGDLTDLVATVTAAMGISSSVTWESSNADVASVSATGQVTADSVGTATITATSSIGSVVGSALIVVSPPAVTELSLPSSTGAIAGPGGTLQLSPTLRAEPGASSALVWTSSNPDAATVSSSGLVTGVAVGRTTISVATPDGQFKASARITVGAPTLRIRSLATDQPLYSVGVNSTVSANVVSSPANAAGRFVRWQSSNRSIVKVDRSGRMTGVAPGNALLTAFSSDGTVHATARVRVTQPVTAVTLDRTNIVLMKRKATVLAASLSPVSASVQSLLWTSSDPSVISVDSRGRVYARGRGKATISVASAAGGRKATCTVRVR